MNNPLFWLGISILLVAISLMALLTVAIFVLQELARAARSAEKLLDTLNRELPATLQDIRLTGKDLSGLSDEVASSVKSARNVVEQVDKGLVEAKVQAQKAQITTRSLVAGATAVLRVLIIGKPRRRRRPPSPPPVNRPTVSDPPSESLGQHGLVTQEGARGKAAGARGAEAKARQEERPPKLSSEFSRTEHLP